ncbi:MAG: S9 family peptidase [Simkaniaceae bacterium]|nr:S9 family peptidase [Simkaniaceae bacterium]
MNKKVLFSLLIASALHAQWNLDSFFDLHFCREIEIAPSGEAFVYSNRTLDLAKNCPKSHLWQGKTNGSAPPAPLLLEDSLTFYASFSPDETQIAYLKHDGQALNLHVLDRASGTSKQITDLPAGIDTFKWAPNSQQIAFVAKAPPKSCEKPPVFEFQWWENETQLYLADLDGNYKSLLPDSYNPIGTGDFSLRLDGFDWSPDGQKIAFSYITRGGIDAIYKKQKIAILDLQTGALTHLHQFAPRQSTPKFSPDGDSLAFLKSDKRALYTFCDDLMIYDCLNDSYRTLAQTPNRGGGFLVTYLLGWVDGGQALLVTEESQTKQGLWKVPANGDSIERFDNDKWVFINPKLSHNGKWLGLNLQTSETAEEVYYTSTTAFEPKKLTDHNSLLQIEAKTITTQWKSADGTQIEGLVTLPRGYQRGKRYPLIVHLHGGPAAAACERFLGTELMTPVATLAEKGFVIFQPNFRGSSGYGKKFRKGNINDFGGRDYQDIMTGVDALIAKGLVDESRMGVSGWSYGGYLSAWIIGQTDRFAAACMGAGLSNLTSLNNSTDIYSYIPDYFPGQNSTLLSERSPINYVDQMKTPLLILHGAKDQRAPLSQSIELYTALKKRNIPVSLYIYRKARHNLPTPKMLLDAMQRHYDHFIPLLKEKTS